MSGHEESEALCRRDSWGMLDEVGRQGDLADSTSQIKESSDRMKLTAMGMMKYFSRVRCFEGNEKDMFDA